MRRFAAEFQHRGNSEVVIDSGLVAAAVEPPLSARGRVSGTRGAQG
jgi:hypothetical protein